jgi:hypothetical protein
MTNGMPPEPRPGLAGARRGDRDRSTVGFECASIAAPTRRRCGGCCLPCEGRDDRIGSAKRYGYCSRSSRGLAVMCSRLRRSTATTVPVLKPGLGRTRGCISATIVRSVVPHRRERSPPAADLAHFKGFLQADTYSGFAANDPAGELGDCRHCGEPWTDLAPLLQRP